MVFDWNALVVLFNTIALAFVAYYSRKNANKQPTQIKSHEEVWMEINDLRATLNRTLTAVNKQLRGHGRTLQNEEVKKADLPGGRSGLIIGRR